MRLPRDVSGQELAQQLGKLGYMVVRQTGSHIRLVGESGHHVTIPRHRQLKIGTLSDVLKDVAEHLEMTREEVLGALWR